MTHLTPSRIPSNVFSPRAPSPAFRFARFSSRLVDAVLVLPVVVLTSCAFVSCGGEVADLRASGTAGTAGSAGSAGTAGASGSGAAGTSSTDGTSGTCGSPGCQGPSASPVPLSAGMNHTCAITATGAVKCWGANNCAKCPPPTASSDVAVEVDGLSSGAIAVSAGVVHTCALTTTGAVKCWGGNAGGVLGDGSLDDSTLPVDVVGLSSGVLAVSSGAEHTCAVVSSGKVVCWGKNDHGQLGNGSLVDSAVPVEVAGLSNVIAVSGGYGFTCAVSSSGGISCWGWNVYGQLGDHSHLDRLSPVVVEGLSSGVRSVSAGWGHACAITQQGAVVCWGANSAGALGNDSIDESTVPVDVLGLYSGFSSVSASGVTTCAVSEAGAALCWGADALGNDQTFSSWVPVDVTGLSSGVRSLDTGMGHACAVMATGGVRCWGDNYMGQLGDGSTEESLVPVDVVGL